MGVIRQRYQFSQEIQNELATLRSLDNWHCFLGVLYDYAIIAIAMALFCLQPWCYPISLILIGSRQRALATLLHESAHLCLAKSRSLNKFVGTFLSGYLILQEFETYRDSHVKRHHAYLGDAQLDPDYQYHQQEKLYTYKGCIGFFQHYIFGPLLLSKTASYLNYLVKHRLKIDKCYKRNFLQMFCYWGVIFTICAYFKVLHYLFLLWFVPLMTTSAVFGWFNELAEHYPLVGLHSNELYMTRNRFSHWLEHFLCNTHHENYHLVHHLRATIPYWHLKQAHQVMLRDENYAKFNQNMGGVFASNNGNIPLLKRFLMDPVITRNGQIQYE